MVEPNADPLGPEGLHGLQHPGLGVGVLGQALQEGGLEDAIELLHGGLVGGSLVLLPLPLDGGHGQHGAVVSRFSMPMGARISSTVGFTPNFWKARQRR